uniref:Uncharacterized protein n=1 Tax=Leersia perrieri TaxID=77586 RepID=A0A0D9X130_9ORYZ
MPVFKVSESPCGGDSAPTQQWGVDGEKNGPDLFFVAIIHFVPCTRPATSLHAVVTAPSRASSSPFVSTEVHAQMSVTRCNFFSRISSRSQDSTQLV